MNCCGAMKINCWSAFLPPIPKWSRSLASCTRHEHFNTFTIPAAVYDRKCAFSPPFLNNDAFQWLFHLEKWKQRWRICLPHWAAELHGLWPCWNMERPKVGHTHANTHSVYVLIHCNGTWLSTLWILKVFPNLLLLTNVPRPAVSVFLPSGL